MNAPVMTDDQAGERQALHARTGELLANLTGAPDERRHLLDVIGLLSARCSEASAIMQLRICQMHVEMMRQEIAALQKPSQMEN